MKEKIICIILGIIIGITISSISLILIMSSPKIKYDLNHDGEVNILDLIKIRNYILEEE